MEPSILVDLQYEEICTTLPVVVSEGDTKGACRDFIYVTAQEMAKVAAFWEAVEAYRTFITELSDRPEAVVFTKGVGRRLRSAEEVAAVGKGV